MSIEEGHQSAELWYVAEHKESTSSDSDSQSTVLGPLSRLDLISFANGGKVKADSLLYCAAFSPEWKPLTEFQVLRECESLPREWFAHLHTNLYYYSDSYGNERGPVTLEELLFNERANGGELHAKSHVRSEHSHVWKLLCDVIESQSDGSAKGKDKKDMIDEEDCNAEGNREEAKKSSKRNLSEMAGSDGSDTSTMNDGIKDDTLEDFLKEVDNSTQQMKSDHRSVLKESSLKDGRKDEVSSDLSADQSGLPSKKKRKKKSKRKGKIVNKSVYITGLPSHCTDEDLTRVFEQCGLVHRVRLYRHKSGPDEGTLKGDAFVTFKRPESVAIAIERLHQTVFDTNDSVDQSAKNNSSSVLMTVEVAQFVQQTSQV